jgi:hypothetical protein
VSTAANAIAEAERAGIDLSLIDVNLSYSYEQRAIQHQEALNLALELERVGRELRERNQSPATGSWTEQRRRGCAAATRNPRKAQRCRNTANL